MKRHTFINIHVLATSLPLSGANDTVAARVASRISLLDLATRPDEAVKSIALDGVMTESVDYLASNAVALAMSNFYRITVDEEARDEFLTNLQLHQSLKSVDHLNEQEHPHIIPVPEALHIPARAILTDLCRKDRNFFIPVTRPDGSYYRLLYKPNTTSAAASKHECKQLKELRAQLIADDPNNPSLLVNDEKGHTSPLRYSQLKSAYENNETLNIWQQLPHQLHETLCEAILPPELPPEEVDEDTKDPRKKIKQRWRETGKLREAVAQVCLEQGHQKIKKFKKELPNKALEALTNGLLSSDAMQASDLDMQEKKAICHRIAQRMIDRLGAPAVGLLVKQFTTDDRCIAQQKFNPFSYSFARYNKESNSLYAIAPNEAATLLQDKDHASTVFVQHRSGCVHAQDLPDASLLNLHFFIADKKNPEIIHPVAFDKVDIIANNPLAYNDAYWCPEHMQEKAIRYVSKKALKQKDGGGMQTLEEVDGVLVPERIPPFTITPGLLSQYGQLGSSLVSCHLLHTFFGMMRRLFLLESLTGNADALAALLCNHPTSLNHQQEIASFFTSKHRYITYTFFKSKAMLTVLMFIAGLAIMEQVSDMLATKQRAQLVSFGSAWSHRILTAFNHWRLAPMSGGPEQLNSLANQFQHELLAHLKQYGAVTIPFLPAIEFLLTGHSSVVPNALDLLATPSKDRYGSLAQRIFFFKAAGLSKSPYPSWYRTLWLPVVQKVLNAFFMLRCLDNRYTKQWGQYVSTHQPKLKKLLSEYSYYAARNSQPAQILDRLREYISNSMPVISTSMLSPLLKRLKKIPGASIITSGATGYHALMTAQTYTNGILLLPLCWEWLLTHTALSEYSWAKPAVLATAAATGIGLSIGYHYINRAREVKKYLLLQKLLTSESQERNSNAA